MRVQGGGVSCIIQGRPKTLTPTAEQNVLYVPAPPPSKDACSLTKTPRFACFLNVNTEDKQTQNIFTTQRVRLENTLDILCTK